MRASWLLCGVRDLNVAWFWLLGQHMRCPSPAHGLNAGSWGWGWLFPQRAVAAQPADPHPSPQPVACFPLVSLACLEMQEPKGPLRHVLLVIVWPYLLASMAWPCFGAVGIERCCGPCILHPWSHERCVGFQPHPVGKRPRFSFQRTAEPLGPLPYTTFPGGGFKEISSVLGCFVVCGVEPGGTHPSSPARYREVPGGAQDCSVGDKVVHRGRAAAG